jgi:putative ABC transport system substrate-binding protein
MRRREFVTLLGGAAVGVPLVARAQRGAQTRRIGILMTNEESDPRGQARVAAFRDALQRLGWTEGRNLLIEYRWATDAGRLRTYAAELVAMPLEVIFCGAPAARVLQQATRTMPIVFIGVPDPVAEGLVASLARPGGNLTGFGMADASIAGKRLQLLKEIAPRVTRVAYIHDPVNPNWSDVLRKLETEAASFGVKIFSTAVRSGADIERAIEAFAGDQNGGLWVFGGPTTNFHSELITSLALRYGLPGAYPFRFYAVGGGLVSYNVDQTSSYPGAAAYVDRILKGEKPADLPVMQPTKFELVINAQAARTLGLIVPPTLIALADEVIE